MTRQRLPNRRRSETFAFRHNGMAYTATVSRFPGSAALAEIFLTNHKTGSDADANCKDAAVVCSIALQHGVPTETIRRALVRNADGSASSPLGTALDLLAEEEGR